ncbi:TetR/AcrR family transcriptional regulator [Amycolatopsis jiangsuensis]|uniref:AcrR family transcriptional regulator n=1 Tax=Amycolatopsis jiangsuensis TaxID=1181879 RepID=A0A840J5K7_9PSEU|nr:TetR/AcrR family transcriptional regulator [Amycolatopsis jiangsuensis]MBB4688688.1 AcrR family transcriptional regulator [Amycolatopsis jiangsuensis]
MGLREQKKQATREALREAALRLALEHGPSNVRVDDIAEAAGVSPRTYNNYFASREDAIVAAVTAERETRIGHAIAGKPPGTRLATAIRDAIVEQYTTPGAHHRETLRLITDDPAVRAAFLHQPATLEGPLTTAIADRLAVPEGPLPRVLAAGVAAAVRIALESWIRPAGSGLVVAAGSLPDLLHEALDPLTPALDAAEADNANNAG